MHRLHILWGSLGLLFFVATGLYMRLVVGVEHLPDAERLLYRSSHIYIMLGFAANLFLGSCLSRRRLSVLEWLCSALVLLAPAVLAASFFLELSRPGIDRPMANLALFGLFGAAALLALRECWSALRGGTGVEA